MYHQFCPLGLWFIGALKVVHYNGPADQKAVVNTKRSPGGCTHLKRE